MQTCLQHGLPGNDKIIKTLGNFRFEAGAGDGCAKRRVAEHLAAKDGIAQNVFKLIGADKAIAQHFANECDVLLR